MSAMSASMIDLSRSWRIAGLSSDSHPFVRILTIEGPLKVRKLKEKLTYTRTRLVNNKPFPDQQVRLAICLSVCIDGAALSLSLSLSLRSVQCLRVLSTRWEKKILSSARENWSIGICCLSLASVVFLSPFHVPSPCWAKAKAFKNKQKATVIPYCRLHFSVFPLPA